MQKNIRVKINWITKIKLVVWIKLTTSNGQAYDADKASHIIDITMIIDKVDCIIHVYK